MTGYAPASFRRVPIGDTAGRGVGADWSEFVLYRTLKHGGQLLRRVASRSATVGRYVSKFTRATGIPL